MVEITQNGKTETIDVEVENHGSILLIYLLSDAAQDWVEEHVEAEDCQWFGTALAVEQRMAGDLAQGMADAGLIVR